MAAVQDWLAAGLGAGIAGDRGTLTTRLADGWGVDAGTAVPLDGAAHPAHATASASAPAAGIRARVAA